MASPKRKARLELDENIFKFFPRTSRMGGEIATPWTWGRETTVVRNGEDDSPKPRRPRRRRVTMSTPL
jgi:hypothetical protein